VITAAEAETRAPVRMLTDDQRRAADHLLCLAVMALSPAARERAFQAAGVSHNTDGGAKCTWHQS
jgi:hypothetical protein